MNQPTVRHEYFDFFRELVDRYKGQQPRGDQRFQYIELAKLLDTNEVDLWRLRFADREFGYPPLWKDVAGVIATCYMFRAPIRYEEVIRLWYLHRDALQKYPRPTKRVDTVEMPVVRPTPRTDPLQSIPSHVKFFSEEVE